MNNLNAVQWNQLKPLSVLKHERNSQVITREEYWTEIRDRLAFSQDLIEISKRENLTFTVNPNGIEIEIPLGAFEKSVQMVLDVSDIRSVPFTVIAEGPYEQFQAQILFSLGMVSRHFLDVGANMGYYSLALGLLNPKIAIESFEPQPEIFALLTRNIALNKLDNQIVGHNCGLGPRDENFEIHVPRFTGSGGGSFADQHPEEENPKRFFVPVKCLDTLLAPNFAVDLIKIDIEGFEYEMLKGSREILMKYKPTLVIELLRKWMKTFGHHPQDVIEFLTPLGYEAFSIGSNQLSRIVEIDETTTETNFIFVHNTRALHYEIIEKNL